MGGTLAPPQAPLPLCSFLQETQQPPPQLWSRWPGSWAQAKRQTRLPGPHAGETLPELFSWLRREMWAPSTTPLNTAGAFQPVVRADSALLTRRPSLKLGSDPPTLQVRKEPEASRAWA